MKNKILSLAFGSALLLGSFALSSFQLNSTKAINTDVQVIAGWECTATNNCENGNTISCSGTKSCTVTARGIVCDGEVTLCYS